MECSALVDIEMAVKAGTDSGLASGLCCVLALVLSKVGDLMLWFESELSLKSRSVKNAPYATECR